MAHLSPAQYDALERAIIDRRRIVILRRGTEVVVIPVGLRAAGSTEIIDALHPTTGEPMAFPLDALDDVQVVP